LRGREIGGKRVREIEERRRKKREEKKNM